MNSKIAEGLVFAVPLGDGTFGFGQLIAERNPIFYMAGYDLRKDSNSVTEEEISNSSVIVLDNFFDVLLRNGRWQPVTKMAIPDVPFPYYKVVISGQFWLENWKGDESQLADEDHARFTFRKDIGPIRFENALKAFFDLIPFEEKFEELEIASVFKRSFLKSTRTELN